jgi:hypothetical protein
MFVKNFVNRLRLRWQEKKLSRRLVENPTPGSLDEFVGFLMANRLPFPVGKGRVRHALFNVPSW